ncbi:hypothetical protein M011DRAFT_153846 [Sporormia fimetaria CBS 119925]|uniref:Uncharacterized protein n=1 Tax=Sporormia fimetaria CBS 119925 TaxID=1340428 RepID=A0A6A6V700_9PLEO|nr:hypothetical protein M011DRAFT_153846 [Sporormia fimetaria CBS 119925]
MRSFLRLACLALPIAGAIAAAEPVSNTKESKPIYANAHEAFRDLLNALPEESLHAALNRLAPYQEGVFESNRHGVERVHHENPPLATKLIVAAVQDLRKRQTPSNGTTTRTPEPSSQPPPEPPRSSQPPPIVVPVPITTTNDRGEETVSTSEILSEATQSAVVTSTRVNEDGQSEVVTVTRPAIVITRTNSAGSTVVETSAVDFAPTPGQRLTRTDSRGSTFFTTYTPGGGRVSSVKLITTTGPDGAPSVITSYTYVDPTATAGGDGPAETNGEPTVQRGAAPKNPAMGAAVLGGALGAFALWL